MLLFQLRAKNEEGSPMQRRVQVLHFVFLVALAIVLASCAAPAATPAPAQAPAAAAPTEAPAAAEAKAAAPTFTGEPIQLGLQAPLSGPYAAEGLAIKQAVELMVEQSNAVGGINGREVILLVEDDRGDPAVATQAAERLVSQGVVAVIGSYNAATTDPASYVYNRAGVINLMPSCAQPLAMDKGFHQTFRLCFREERTAQATADFVTEVLDAQTIAIVHDGSPDATKLAEGVQQDVAGQGAQVVAYEAVNPAAPEVQALVERLKLANPEVIYYAGSAAPVATVVRQARDAGLQVIWVLSDSAYVPELVGLAGPQNMSGAYIVADPLPSLLADPATQRFVTDYRAKFNAEPILWGAMAADATLLVEEATRAMNSTDPQVLASYLHDRLRGFVGITGQIEGFDSAGDRVGTGNVVLVFTSDGHAVLSPKQP
jgi:branched-chain amino acid transport system substrate-binding protein